MASRKTRAKRRQERMQQLQRNTAIPPAQASIEELKATNPSEAQQALLPNEREGIPAKEVEQRIECVPLAVSYTHLDVYKRQPRQRAL